MYQVYSQEKGGRPVLAIAASVLTLGMTVLMAFGVIADRQRISDTKLGERIRLEPWAISLCGPVGWSSYDRLKSSSRVVFVEGNPGGATRQLEIQRFGPRPFFPPSFYAQPAILSQMLGVSASAIRRSFTDLGPRPMGDMPGTLIKVGRLAVHLGVSPDGYVYKTVLDNPSGIRPSDLKLLEEFGATVELHDPAILLEPATLWEAGPYRFEAPEGTRYTGGDGLNPDRIVCFGDPQTKGTWHIETTLTFLAPGRTPDGLLRNHCSRMDQGAEPQSVETGGAIGGEYARRFTVDEDRLHQSIAVRRIGPNTAALLVGIADETGRDALRAAERKILDTIELVGATPDLSRELERGRRLAQRVRRDVAEQWSGRERTRWYLIARGGNAIGFYRIVRGAGRLRGSEGYLVDTLYSYEIGKETFQRGRSQSFVSVQGDAASLTGRNVQGTGGREMRWELREEWDQDTGTIERSWSSGEGGDERRTLHVDANFLPDPLPEWAYYVVAAEADPDEAFLISTSGLITVHDSAWVRIEPLRAGTMAEGNESRGLGAIVRYDYDPEPEQWYFDSRGELRELRLGNGLSLLACTERDVFDRFRRAPRIIAGLEAWWD